MREVDYINKDLEKYGRDLRGRPLFRVVWSDDQFEVRKGTFNDFTGSGILIRSETGVKRVPKYNYIKERWILERLWFGRNDELPESEREGSYENIYTFEARDGSYLPLDPKALEPIMYTLLEVTPGEKRKDMDAKEKAKRKASYDYLYNYLDKKTLTGEQVGEQMNGYKRDVDWNPGIKPFDYSNNNAFDKA